LISERVIEKPNAVGNKKEERKKLAEKNDGST